MIDCDLNLFQRVKVYQWFKDKAIIKWDYRLELVPPADAEFYVDYAESAGADWVTLNPEDPVIDDIVYTDEVQRDFGLTKRGYYKVRAEVDGETIHESDPVNALGVLSQNDWLLAREIARVKMLELKKGNGIPGVLFKRRRAGTRCTICADHDTGERINYACATCYGTGFVSGFFNGILAYIKEVGESGRRKITHEATGAINPLVKKVESVAYPDFETEDVWVNMRSGERYYVQTVQNSVLIGGLPIVQVIELRLAPFTDIIYKLEGPADYMQRES